MKDTKAEENKESGTEAEEAEESNDSAKETAEADENETGEVVNDTRANVTAGDSYWDLCLPLL